jgi:hypothetical protein
MIRPLFNATFAVCIAVLVASCASTQDGTPSWSGGASHRKLSEVDFVVSSGTNGGSGPARLRPLLIAHARQLAAAGGYAGFVVLNPALERQSNGEGHVATAAVRLTNSEPVASERYEYFSTAATLPASRSQEGAVEMASIVGSTAADSSEMRGSFFPWYVDAAESTGGFWGTQSLMIRPGEQSIGVWFVVCKTLVSGCRQGSLPMRVSIEAGVAYRVSGEVKGGNALVWIENTKTGVKVRQGVVTLQ